MVHVDDKFISNLGAAALLDARMDHVESVENSAGREAVEEFWEKAVESKCEGLMIKVQWNRFPSSSQIMFLITNVGQLLDNTQVGSDVDAGTGVNSPLADLDEDADEFAKARRQGDFNGPQSKSRKKPLPATYEPGTLPVPPAVTKVETMVLVFSELKHSHRQADLRLAQTQERLC